MSFAGSGPAGGDHADADEGRARRAAKNLFVAAEAQGKRRRPGRLHAYRTSQAWPTIRDGQAAIYTLPHGLGLRRPTLSSLLEDAIVLKLKDMLDDRPRQSAPGAPTWNDHTLGLILRTKIGAAVEESSPWCIHQRARISPRAPSVSASDAFAVVGRRGISKHRWIWYRRGAVLSGAARLSGIAGEGSSSVQVSSNLLAPFGEALFYSLLRVGSRDYVAPMIHHQG